MDAIKSSLRGHVHKCPLLDKVLVLFSIYLRLQVPVLRFCVMALKFLSSALKQLSIVANLLLYKNK